MLDVTQDTMTNKSKYRKKTFDSFYLSQVNRKKVLKIRE